MRKLTLLFLASALGASVLGAKPAYAEESGFFEWGKKQIVSLFTTSEQDAQEVVDEEVDGFLAALRNELKKQGKKPCATCGSMMEPGDPRIPLDHFNSSRYYAYKGK